jgi:hypothetical protein
VKQTAKTEKTAKVPFFAGVEVFAIKDFAV